MGAGTRRKGRPARVGIRPARLRIVPGRRERRDQHGARRGRHQDVPRGRDPGGRHAGRRHPDDHPRAARRHGRPRTTRSVPATRSPSSGTDAPPSCWPTRHDNRKRPEDTMNDQPRPAEHPRSRETKAKLDELHRAGRTRGRSPDVTTLGAGARWPDAAGAACGSTSTGTGARQRVDVDAPTRWPGSRWRDHLEIYNWSQYDDPSTYKKFMALPAEAKAGLKIHETYYSSNDELLAKLNAGGTTYDIIAPSQNAVAQLIEKGKLLAMDPALMPNLKNLDPDVPQAVVRPDRSVPRDQGLRDHDVLLQQQGRHRAADDDARLLQAAAQVRQQGPDEPARRRGGGRAAGPDGARPGPQHRQARATSTR